MLEPDEDQDVQAPEETPKKRRQVKDPEIEALKTVVDALSPLDAGVQQRIVAWVAMRFASSCTVTAVPMPVPE